MIEKTKRITVNDVEYSVRRMTPATACYLWHRLQAGVLKMQASMTATTTEQQPQEDVEAQIATSTPEQKVRTICAMAFMQWSLDEFSLAQKECMKVLSRYENDAPMPVMADSGQWATRDDIESDPFLVTRLMIEVLVFNLSGFLA